MAGYREAQASCPRCSVRLARAGAGLGCQDCGGVWIEERILDEMVREMHDGIGALRLVARERDREVHCPACHAALDNVVLEGIPVERCPAKHGVWFDADELQLALQAVASADPTAAPGEAGTPNVRIGFWRGLLNGIGGGLGVLGTGLAGTVVLAGSVAAASVDDRPGYRTDGLRLFRKVYKPKGDV